jgi:hypothetical protein
VKVGAGEIDLAGSRSQSAGRWDWIALSPQYVINPARRLTTNNRLDGGDGSDFD